MCVMVGSYYCNARPHIIISVVSDDNVHVCNYFLLMHNMFLMIHVQYCHIPSFIVQWHNFSHVLTIGIDGDCGGDNLSHEKGRACESHTTSETVVYWYGQLRDCRLSGQVSGGGREGVTE